MQYHHREIEAKWQKYWEENKTFKAENHSTLPKYYVLDMFPYPSGAGLHVGHPLGYIASDIFSRYKRLKGFNVLHPMGYDSFGLPAEQYAIQTGQHPAITTEVNIKGGIDKQGNKIEGYEKQLKKIGLAYDWDRELRTSDPSYYKWTQWIFIQLFNSYYDNDLNQARSIDELINVFEQDGNIKVNAASDEDTPNFTAEEWNNFSEKEQQEILLKYRLTFLAEAEVNWCAALGTVLANDEVVNGVSERGGYPVVRKKMTQWMMRITAFADRLLNGLEGIDWPTPIKDAQTYWIGKSKGASIQFAVQNSEAKIEVFTTRPDTVFGVSYVTLAPEHPLVNEILTEDRKEAVLAYVEQTSKRSERERMADVTKITGEFTGAYAIHPFTGKEVPIWIGDYVLSGYGTGAVMAVPAGDERDYKFAKHFGLPIIPIFKDKDLSETAFVEKEGFELQNSDILNGLGYQEATDKIIALLEEKGIGKGKVNFRLRDAVFSRQRYWGEPVPAYYKDGVPYMIGAAHLPLILPEVDEYLPTETGEPPLGRAKKWAWDTEKNEVVSNDLIDNVKVFPLELNTMPGWAGSSWYFLRYMNPHNPEEFASKEALNYWKEVDLYMGGSEHATGHLLYARFWQKFLFDRGFVPTEEFAQKLINQGMILGMSAYVGVLRLFNYSYDPTIVKDFKPKTPIIIYDYDLHKKYNDLHSKLVASKLEKNDLDYILDNGNQWVFNLINSIEKEDEPLHDVINKLFLNDLGDLKKIGSLLIEYLKEFKKLNSDFEGIDNYGYSSFQSPYVINISFSKYRVGLKFIDESNNHLNIELFEKFNPEFLNGKYLFENEVIVGREIEKMSKSFDNVVNPDDICEQYGADTLRLYEMFLGPIEQAKPWNTQGLSGVSGFLKKLWRLYHSGEGENFFLSDEEPSKEEMKVLHQTIKKVDDDINNFSFNTSVSNFMIAVNELTKLNSNKRAVLEPLLVIISPYAPHIAEELWEKAGNKESISKAKFPEFDAKWLVEDAKEYPVSFNGKMRFKLELPMDLTKEQIQEAVMADERTLKQLEGRTPKNIIIVPGKIINIVG